MSEVPHPIPFRTRSLSPPEPMVLRLKARESRSPRGLPDTQDQVVKRQSSNPSSLTLRLAAGWSSPVARQAHNLKVAGSNPAPAPKHHKSPADTLGGAFCRSRLIPPSKSLRPHLRSIVAAVRRQGRWPVVVALKGSMSLARSAACGGQA
jgi:hypothetical protein